jgi:hypothetical protein
VGKKKEMIFRLFFRAAVSLIKVVMWGPLSVGRKQRVFGLFDKLMVVLGNARWTAQSGRVKVGSAWEPSTGLVDGIKAERERTVGSDRPALIVFLVIRHFLHCKKIKNPKTSKGRK